MKILSIKLVKENKVWFTTVATSKLVIKLSAYITKLKNSFVLEIRPPNEILSSLQGSKKSY